VNLGPGLQGHGFYLEIFLDFFVVLVSLIWSPLQTFRGLIYAVLVLILNFVALITMFSINVSTVLRQHLCTQQKMRYSFMQLFLHKCGCLYT